MGTSQSVTDKPLALCYFLISSALLPWASLHPESQGEEMYLLLLTESLAIFLFFPFQEEAD